MAIKSNLHAKPQIQNIGAQHYTSIPLKAVKVKRIKVLAQIQTNEMA